MKIRAGIAAAAFAAILFASLPGLCAEPANLTALNRAALSETVEQLQQYELHRMNRGRLKPNPVVFPLHTIYQMVLQDQEFLLDKHNSVYENALMRLIALRSSRAADLSAGDGGKIADMFDAELIAVYTLPDRLKDQETILGVWKILEGAKYEMELLPERAAMAYNARKWAVSMYGGTLPVDVSAALEKLASEKLTADSALGMEKATSALSEKYSELFRKMAAGEKFDAAPERGGAK